MALDMPDPVEIDAEINCGFIVDIVTFYAPDEHGRRLVYLEDVYDHVSGFTPDEARQFAAALTAAANWIDDAPPGRPVLSIVPEKDSPA